VRVETIAAHPQGKSRPKRLALRVWGIGASAHGDNRLPEGTDHVTIHATCDDGVDLGTSTRVTITLGLGEDPNRLDELIGKLTDLRSHQQRRALTK